MKDDLVLEALQKKVIAAVAASGTPTLPVKYIGRVFNPPSDGKWLELVFIPNNPEDEVWGDTYTYRGMLRLILHYPIDDTGIYIPLGVIKSIVSSFSKNEVLHDVGSTIKVRIINMPRLLDVIEEPPELLLPVSIRYSCFDA